MKFILIIFTSIPLLAFGQFNSKHIDEFQHKTIIINNDTIKYHIYSKGKIGDKSKILFFFQGSGPKPLFQKGTFIDTLKVNVDGEIKNEIKNSTWFGTSVPINLDKIPEEFLFVVISKKGVPFLDIDNKFKPNQLYYENEGLNYRVWQGDKVIKDITKKLLKKPEKIVILGHSEGSDVVAKLGYTNKKVTHIGYWAGGANTQYYEYALMIQKSVLKGDITQEEGLKEIDSLFAEIKNIQNEPKNTSKKWWGNTYRRWSQFTEPPIDNLLKIEKPIYIAVGAKDKSVPFESSLLIPIEFIRHNKNNLTFKMFPNYNHSFAIEPKTENEKIVREFMNVFEDFMRWVEQ
jgi:esterase/lipase